MALKAWNILDSRYLLKDKWLTLRADQCSTEDGDIIDPFYVIEQDDWAHVVAFDEEGRVLIVRQYRHGSRTICAELPCGIIDDTDSSPLEAIKRELLEETGCIGDRFESLPTLYPNPARQTNRVYSFVAFGVKQVETQTLDKHEKIEFEFIELQKLFELIDSGEFSQSLHVASVFTALRKCGLLHRAENTGFNPSF